MFEKPKHISFAFVRFTLLATLTLTLGCAEKRGPDRFEPFRAHLSEYTPLPALTTEALAGGPYIVGRALPIGSGKYRPERFNNESPEVDSVTVLGESESWIDEVYFALPTDLRPKAPEEVKTIIRLQYSGTVVGHYGESGSQVGSAHKLSCTVSIIDRERNAIVGYKTFVGDDPPDTLTTGDRVAPGYHQHKVGSFERAGKEILEYVTNLPRRP